MGRGHQGAPAGHVRAGAPRRRLLARAVEGRRRRSTRRIINTTSSSGIYGNVGQTNYGAAKAGIAAFTIIAAMELGRYGVTVNAIAPAALTRMTEDLVRWQRRRRRQADAGTRATRQHRAARRLARLAASRAAITGRVFNVTGGNDQRRRGLGRRPGRRQGRALGAGRARRGRPRPRRRGAGQQRHQRRNPILQLKSGLRGGRLRRF